MMRHFAPSVAILLTSLISGCQEDTSDAEAVTVPSGREVRLIDIITNARGPDGATARFRFLVPGLSPDDADSAAEDMQVICESFALPRTDGMVPAPQQIIVSFASAEVPFGEPAPEVVQFFEAYRVENASCIWAVF
jgi:hypothetical protein